MEHGNPIHFTNPFKAKLHVTGYTPLSLSDQSHGVFIDLESRSIEKSFEHGHNFKEFFRPIDSLSKHDQNSKHVLQTSGFKLVEI